MPTTEDILNICAEIANLVDSKPNDADFITKATIIGNKSKEILSKIKVVDRIPETDNKSDYIYVIPKRKITKTATSPYTHGYRIGGK